MRPRGSVVAHGVVDQVVDHPCQQRLRARHPHGRHGRVQLDVLGGDRLTAPGQRLTVTCANDTDV